MPGYSMQGFNLLENFPANSKQNNSHMLNPIGTGYSGDDEESVRCDICSNGVDSGNHAKENGCHKRKSKRRSKRNKHWRRTKKKLKEAKENGIVLRELPRTDNFEFEGEKRVEMKWTLECFLDTNLLPKLRRVIIDRGREEDLGMENLLVFDESSRYAEIQSWRQNTLIQLGQRNAKETSDFDMLPTHLSCDSCIELRQKEIQIALNEGKSLKLSENPSPYMMGQNRERTKSEESKALWRKKVVYDLKLNNCRALACIRAVRRESVMTTSYRFGKSPKRHNGILEVDDEDWEVYEIISDDEFLCQMNGL